MRESYATSLPKIIIGLRIPPSGLVLIQSQKNDENGVLKTVAAGHYKIQHEGNYNPVFKLYEANGKFYAYVSIDQDDRWKVFSINGEKSWFYKEN